MLWGSTLFLRFSFTKEANKLVNCRLTSVWYGGRSQHPERHAELAILSNSSHQTMQELPTVSPNSFSGTASFCVLTHPSKHITLSCFQCTDACTWPARRSCLRLIFKTPQCQSKQSCTDFLWFLYTALDSGDLREVEPLSNHGGEELQWSNHGGEVLQCVQVQSL